MTQATVTASERRAIPGFTAVVLTSLAFGIGLNVLIFSFTKPVLFGGLPYPEPDRIVDIGMAPPGKPEARGPLTPPLYFLLRDKTGAAFEAVGVFDAGRSENLAGDAGGAAERMDGHRITATGLAALGAKPQLGRLPTAADEATGAPRTMVLSYPLWQRRFAGRADVVNQTVQVDGQPMQILGVMPEGFGLLDAFSDAFYTYGFEPTPAQATQHTLRGIGRLKPGVSIAEAQAATRLAMDEYAKMFPTRDKGWTVELVPWREARFGGMRRPLTMVQLGVGVLLLLLCVNLAVLVFARTAMRGPTGAVLRKSLMLALGGGLIGAVVAWLGLPALRTLTPRVLPRLDEVAFDAGVFAFAAGLCLVAGLVIGIVPALRASRPDTARGGVGGLLSATLLTVLLAVQVALAFVLLAAAGLGIRALSGLRSQDVGIDPVGLLSVDVHLPRDPYVTPVVTQGGPELAEYNPAGPALYDRIRASLQTMPGVVQAAGVLTQPFASAPYVQFFIGEAEHTPDNQVTAQYLAVTENYLKTMGIRLVKGRDFAPADQTESPWVILVNEALAKQHWPTGDPLGQKLTLTFQPNDEEPQREIVGLVADTLPFRGASEVPPLIYVLQRQQMPQQRASFEGRRTVMSFVVRTTGDPLALGDAVRAQVGKVDTTTPVKSIRTVESYLNNAGQSALLDYAGTLLGIFAIAVLVIGATGMYGATAYGVAQRRTGLTLVLPVVAAVVIGAGAGLYAWLKLGSFITPFLTNLPVTPSDPGMLAVAGGVLVAAAMVACLVPMVGAKRE